MRKLFIPPDPGELIRQARTASRLTQEEAARRTGLRRTRLCELEAGRWRPRLEEQRLLSELLEVPLRELRLSAGDDHRLSRRRKAFPPSPLRYRPPRDRPSYTRLNAARRDWPDLTPVLEDRVARRPDAEAMARYLRDAAFDSGLEFLGALQILTLPCETGWASPLRWGFRSLSVIDPKHGKVVGDLEFPAIYLVEARLLLIPQVTVDVPGRPRLDYLAGVRGPRDADWHAVEFDGQGHNSRSDGDRSARIGLPEVRFREKEILSPDFPRRLVETLRPPRAAAAGP